MCFMCFSVLGKGATGAVFQTKIYICIYAWVYLIYLCSVLGKGATGAVFQGVNKHNGETVAVR